MSYGKKDEDADLGLVKVDRTQVFQEGGFFFCHSFFLLFSPLNTAHMVQDGQEYDQDDS